MENNIKIGDIVKILSCLSQPLYGLVVEIDEDPVLYDIKVLPLNDRRTNEVWYNDKMVQKVC